MVVMVVGMCCMRLVVGSEGGRNAVGGKFDRKGREAFIRRFAINDIPRWGGGGGGGNHVLLVYFFDRTTPGNV